MKGALGENPGVYRGQDLAGLRIWSRLDLCWMRMWGLGCLVAGVWDLARVKVSAKWGFGGVGGELVEILRRCGCGCVCGKLGTPKSNF